MSIQDLLAFCIEFGRDTVIKFDVTDAYSSRANYSDLGLTLDLCGETTLGELHDYVERQIGVEYQGWKGGEYTMSEHSDIWLCEDPSYSGDALTRTLMVLAIK